MISATWDVLAQLAPWLLFGAAVAGLVHVLLPRGFVRRQLRGYWGVGKAVGLGIPLPLCSCGVIPAGLGLRRDGADRGATVGFLISTPQTGIDSLLVSAAFLGWPFALFKVGSALVTGLVGGALTQALVGRADAATDANEGAAGEAASVEARRPTLREGVDHALTMVREIWPWVVVGVVASAAISTYVPRSAMATLGGGMWPVLAALLISLPMYVCATASVPIAAALVAAGMPPGAALVFLMAGPASNVATIGAVYATLGGRALAAYLASIVIGSVALGTAFGFVLPNADAARAVASHAHAHGVIAIGSAVLLTAMVARFALQSLARRVAQRRLARGMRRGPSLEPRHIELVVEGMTCGGCANRLQKSLARLEGVEAAQVDFERKRAVVDGGLSEAQVRQAIRAAGFEA
ncbi:MAG: permease [Myxococcales bacterium]|nr:permease [Myxococcales bacterium]